MSLVANQARYRKIRGSDFYNRSIKPRLHDNDIKLYSTYNEKRTVVAERFIRTLNQDQTRIYNYVTALSKNAYIDTLDKTVDKYNETYHKTSGMKPADVKFGAHTNYSVKYNVKDPKFKVSDHLRISHYKNIFAKNCTSNYSEEVFLIKKV